MNPVLLGVFCINSIFLFGLLHTFKKTLYELVFYFFVWLLVAVSIPLFHHNGVTVLFFLNDNPITAESIFLGIAVGVLVVCFSFLCKSAITYITTEKFLYLFGVIQPHLAIWLVLLLRFVPQYKRNFQEIHGTQKTVGFYATNSLFDRVIGAMKIGKVVLVLTIEQTFSQVDSMKAKGYGLQKRSYFSIYRFYKWDRLLVLWLVIVTGLFMVSFSELNYYYEPTLKAITFMHKTSLIYGILLCVALLPVVIEIKELVLWKYLRSKM